MPALSKGGLFLSLSTMLEFWPTQVGLEAAVIYKMFVGSW